MNKPKRLRKAFRRLVATLPGLAIFMSLSAIGPAGAQYIPPPANQAYAPAQGAAAPQPEAPRASHSSTRRHKSSRVRRQEAETQVIEETPAEPRKAHRSNRKSRAEARAEARERAREARAARAEARAEARAARNHKARAVKAAEDDAADAPESTKQDAGKIVILAGEPATTIARSADEIAEVVDAAGLDVNAKTGAITLAQLSDPEGAADADLAIVQSDALEAAKREGGPDLARKLTFVARLYNQEIHIVARQAVRNFADLEGRTVAVAPADTAEGRTAAKLFERAGLHPHLVEMDHAAALSRLGRGEIDAAVFVGGKPVPAIAEMPVAGLRLVSIPYKGKLQDFYYPATIAKADYPNLVTRESGVDTVAIGTVLVALDAKPGSPRYKKLTQFTDTFFSRFSALRDGAHHPKWREVNLAADVPGWRRFQPAQKWLDNAPTPRVSSVK